MRTSQPHNRPTLQLTNRKVSMSYLQTCVATLSTTRNIPATLNTQVVEFESRAQKPSSFMIETDPRNGPTWKSAFIAVNCIEVGFVSIGIMVMISIRE